MKVYVLLEEDYQQREVYCHGVTTDLEHAKRVITLTHTDVANDYSLDDPVTEWAEDGTSYYIADYSRGWIEEQELDNGEV